MEKKSIADHYLDAYLRKARKGSTNNIAHIKRICFVNDRRAGQILKLGIAGGYLMPVCESGSFHKIPTPAKLKD